MHHVDAELPLAGSRSAHVGRRIIPGRLTVKGAARALAMLVGIVLVTAALGKALDPTSAYPMIRSVLWRDIPDVSLFSIVAATASVEVMLAVALWSNVSPRITSGVLVAVMAGFTVITTILVLDPTAPACGCSGGTKLLAADAQAANQFALGRNLVLLAGSVWLFAASLRRGASPRA